MQRAPTNAPVGDPVLGLMAKVVPLPWLRPHITFLAKVGLYLNPLF